MGPEAQIDMPDTQPGRSLDHFDRCFTGLDESIQELAGKCFLSVLLILNLNFFSHV